jgi:hypothetical protein
LHFERRYCNPHQQVVSVDAHRSLQICYMNVSGAIEPVGSVDVALAYAARLLERDPALAAEQANEILKASLY